MTAERGMEGLLRELAPQASALQWPTEGVPEQRYPALRAAKLRRR